VSPAIVSRTTSALWTTSSPKGLHVCARQSAGSSEYFGERQTFIRATGVATALSRSGRAGKLSASTAA